MKSTSAALSVALILLFALLSGCASPPDITGTAYIRIETDRERYAPGESITSALILVNNQSHDLIFNFSSGHQWDLTVYDSAGREVFDVAKNSMYVQMLTSLRVAASSEVKIGDYMWGQKDESGAQVKSGVYTLKAKLVGYEVRGKKNIAIESRP